MVSGVLIHKFSLVVIHHRRGMSRTHFIAYVLDKDNEEPTSRQGIATLIELDVI